MFELLASVLAAAPIQSVALGPEKRRRLIQNCAILAIDVESFRPLADFRRDADALAAILKALPRQNGIDEIFLPGERAARTKTARRASGIPIPGKLWQELVAIAKSQAIEPPMPLVTSAI
jgi:ureidoglycolate dehydrogenase (NAD+)